MMSGQFTRLLKDPQANPSVQRQAVAGSNQPANTDLADLRDIELCIAQIERDQRCRRIPFILSFISVIGGLALMAVGTARGAFQHDDNNPSTGSEGAEFVSGGVFFGAGMLGCMRAMCFKENGPINEEMKQIATRLGLQTTYVHSETIDREEYSSISNLPRDSMLPLFIAKRDELKRKLGAHVAVPGLSFMSSVNNHAAGVSSNSNSVALIIDGNARATTPVLR